MDGPKKQQLIEALTKRLEDSANSTDEFGLSGRDVGQIVTNIVEDFEKYVEYRNSDKWKDEEGYKWEFIKNRFDNSSVKPIPDVLPNEFFSLRKNLGGSFHGDPFQDKVPWESVTLTNFRDINETDFNTIDVDNEIKKAKNFIEKINKKSNTRATALLLFFLFPKKFCSYNHGSLSKTAKNWGIPDTSPMIPPKGDICYKSWIKFINEIMIPTFKETGTFGDLRQIDNDVPRGIPLDIQDFIYCINKGWLDNLTANTTSQNQTGDNTMKDNFIEILQKLRANKQLILTGAPGTGKTYLAQRLAAWMISDSSEEYPEDISDVEITYETYK
ncbi:MAG: hypothetical protein GX927_10455, partial [Lentisphaerae bacterium]|nr:hypothetical protein [Lentisphaerota bacterium]